MAKFGCVRVFFAAEFGDARPRERSDRRRAARLQLSVQPAGVRNRSASAADFDRSFASPYFPATDVWSSRLTWLTTVTGRVGYGFDNWLPYVKGGFAAGNIETSIQTNPFGVISQGSAVHSGWTLGGGVEFKVAPQFSLGLEFMHTDLGRSTDINGPQIVPGAPESYGVGLRSNSIMARFNYFFGR